MNSYPTETEDSALDGKDIVGVHTYGSMYDQGTVGVVFVDSSGEKKEARLSVYMLRAILHDFRFDLCKSRKYRYLENPELIETDEVIVNRKG